MFYFILFFSLFFATGCTNKATVKSDSEIGWTECANELGDHPCDFLLVDQNGVTVSLYEFYGQPIILDFSTGWCGFCYVAADEVQEVQDKYSSSNLAYITILTEDNQGKTPDSQFCKDWATNFGITSAPVLAGNTKMLSDKPADGWVIGGYPTFFFIDSEMILKSQVVGFNSAAIDEQILSLIN